MRLVIGATDLGMEVDEDANVSGVEPIAKVEDDGPAMTIDEGNGCEGCLENMMVPDIEVAYREADCCDVRCVGQVVEVGVGEGGAVMIIPSSASFVDAVFLDRADVCVREETEVGD